MPEQAIDVNAIIGTYGLAVALVIIGALFVIFKVWPWFIEDQKRRCEAEQARHADYISTYRKSTESTDLLTKVLIEFSTLVKAQHDQQKDQADNNHNEVVGILRNEVITRLDRIDRNTGSGGIMGGKR